jgi:hypothetical protein
MSYLRKQVSIVFCQINFKMDSRLRGNDKKRISVELFFPPVHRPDPAAQLPERVGEFHSLLHELAHDFGLAQVLDDAVGLVNNLAGVLALIELLPDADLELFG